MGYFIGPYKVLEVLGAGSAGIVYLCDHGQMRRRVAVKVLQGEKARDRKSLERFYREARAAATLDHPNIVRAFDVGQGERFHYLVMEYVDGLNLRQIVKNDGPLSATLAADYLRQAALGLRHAHESGLVHRDLKPTNLMVGRDGVVKILDLGLALFFEDEGDILTQGAVAGNADFIAPEQAVDSHSVDVRADIYSLGATFWYCLTGSRTSRSLVEPSRRFGARPDATADRADGRARGTVERTSKDDGKGSGRSLPNAVGGSGGGVVLGARRGNATPADRDSAARADGGKRAPCRQ